MDVKRQHMVIILVSLLMLVGCNNKVQKSLPKTQLGTGGDSVLISIFQRNMKTRVSLYNIPDNKERILLENREAMVTAAIDSGYRNILYCDAMGEEGQWDVYEKNLSSNAVKQITKDPIGEVSPRFGDSDKDHLYFNGGFVVQDEILLRPVQFSIDTGKETYYLPGNKDLDVVDFTVGKERIYTIERSYKEDQESMNIANDKDLDIQPPIQYSIVSSTFDGKDRVVLWTGKASSIDSISISKDEENILFGGENVNNDSDKGYYHLLVKSHQMEQMISEQYYKKNKKIQELSEPMAAYYSEDGKKIYFIATGEQVEVQKYGEIETYPNALYVYNLNQRDITKIYQPEDGFICNLYVGYVK